LDTHIVQGCGNRSGADTTSIPAGHGDKYGMDIGHAIGQDAKCVGRPRASIRWKSEHCSKGRDDPDLADGRKKEALVDLLREKSKALSQKHQF